MRPRSVLGDDAEQCLFSLRTRSHNRARLPMPASTAVLVADIVCAIFGVAMTSIPVNHRVWAARIVTTLGGCRVPGMYSVSGNLAIYRSEIDPYQKEGVAPYEESSEVCF
jgi:hypothetical protein